MSVTLNTMPTLRHRVSARLNDLDARRGTFNSVRIDEAIAEEFMVIRSRLGAPKLMVQSAFTITALSDTFTLPSAAQEEYGGDVRIQLDSDKSFLKKLTTEEIDAFREREQTPTVGSLRPTHFALWEESALAVQGRCWPRPGQSELCHLFRETLATDIRDAADIDAVNVELSRYGTGALVLGTAAELLASMQPEDLKLRRLNPNVAPLWRRKADELLYKEAARRHSLDSVGRVMRWVS